jgi:hypothetical protein
MVVFLFALVGCGSEQPVELPDAGAQAPDEADASSPIDAGEVSQPDAGTVDPQPCPGGQICVDQFPFTHKGDSALSALQLFDRYGCAPNIDEGGAEVVYRIDVPVDGFLSAAVREADGVDVDVHILRSLDAASCVDRGNYDAGADVTPGTWFVVVDTFVNSGVPRAGAYEVDIGFVPPSRGPCELQTGTMPRVGDGGNRLLMPATGKVAREAHLVTQEEPAPFPSTPTDELAEHRALSQSRSGFVMHRRETWAPLEGGTFYGAGIGNPALFPVEHEAWYVNMYWTNAARPPRGTRMILREPSSGRAVVVAAGYETGPGDLTFIGGTPEEPLFYLGASHASVLTLGIAVDQSLPFGPRTCVP